MSTRVQWLLLCILSLLLGIPAVGAAQTVAQLTLSGTTLPPGPLNVTSVHNPLIAGEINTSRQRYPLAGTGQIPAGSIIQEVRLVRISSGTFSPGIIHAGMRPLISDGTLIMQVVNGGPGPVGDPVNSDLLEVYGLNQYALGGTAVFTQNPFTNQPWVRADLDTLMAGFWARWNNTTSDPQSTQLFSLNDFGIEVVYVPLTLTVSPASLALSTGDTGRFLATTADPSTVTISPTFTVGTYTNPNSTCAATLNFAAASGQGTVNSIVTAAPAGCSRIGENVRSNAGGSQSTNSAKVIVPPQVMIRMVVGEAGGQPADVDQLAILVSARNRFGKREFPGGRNATWQDVLILSQYQGLTNTTQNGPDQELRNAATVFAGEIGDIVAGSPCYWSPTNQQWAVVQQALQSGTTVFPANTGAPDCYQGKAQIVYKSSIGLNATGSPVYNNAPAFVFIRQKPMNNAPAAIQIQ